MKNNTISLCIIARNESETLGRCIKSAEEYVDEIVVVDTGSTDNTVEIARNLGVKVIEKIWKDNFSMARNISLKNASCDWILFLDCDEELTGEGGKKLREVVQNQRFEAYFVNIINKLEDYNNVTFSSVRLFRNRDSYYFTGKIHEQILPSILKDNDLQKIGKADILIIHHGYDSSKVNIQAKIRRNLKILNTYPEEKKDGFFYYNLGTEYLRLGKPKQALTYYLKALELTKPIQIYGPILVKKTITILIDLKRYKEALEYLHYYQTIYREYRDLYFLEAICHFNCGRYSESRACMKKYEQLDIDSFFYPTVEAFGGLTADKLCEQLDLLLIKKDYPELSVCIIGRDEEATIPGCIKSVNEIAAEVIYIDTGSTDNSCFLAHHLGTKVHRVEWNNNYSEVKNYALAEARGEWVLLIDADETLPGQTYKKIADLIRESNYDGYVLGIKTFPGKQFSAEHSYITGRCCLFRNNRSYYYPEWYCEDIRGSIVKNGGNINTVDIFINHYHGLANQKHIVEKRKIKMEVIKELAANELVKKYLLAKEYFYEQEFSRTINYYQDIYTRDKDEIAAGVAYYYSQSLLYTKNVARALKVLNKAIEDYSDYTDLVYLKALACYIAGEQEKAEVLFKQCLKMGEAPWDKYIVNPGNATFKPLCSLGLIELMRGNSKKALELYTRAVKMAEGFKKGMEGIVQVFVRTRTDFTLKEFLAENKILNSYSLSTISEIYAKMGRYGDSLEYLSEGFNYIGDESEKLQQIEYLLGITKKLLSGFSVKLKNNLPVDSRTKKFLEEEIL